MNQYGSYLVCKEHLDEVKDFLGQFYEEKKGKYNHDGWITFVVPGTTFHVNLMRGKDQDMTQNMTFEMGCDSLEELEQYAKKYGKTIDSFVATETDNKYRYHYIEIWAPKNICKMEISYSQAL